MPPYAGNGRFAKGGSSTNGFTTMMRVAMRRAAAEDEEIRELTSHSCKATVLSWAAKFGMEVGTRIFLRGHAKPKDRSVLEYSRDAMAAP